MRNSTSPLDLLVPRNKTALMQHLQLLVGREGFRHWCGGEISREKFPAFAEKMSRRYPITRNTRGRSYDRSKEKAVLHFIAFPSNGKIQWWLLSDSGAGGLADGLVEDAKVAKDAMAADSHITFGDYVLLYKSKRELRRIKGGKQGAPTTFYKDVSTWTWQMSGSVMRELSVSVEECCSRLQLGAVGAASQQGWGLNGILGSVRRRPLFSGVRSQAYKLHQEASEQWRRHDKAWRAQRGSSTDMTIEGKGASVLAWGCPPKMSRIKVYDVPPKTMRDLCVAETPWRLAEGEKQ